MIEPLPSFLLKNEERSKQPAGKEKYDLSFLDKTLRNFSSVIITDGLQVDVASKKGYFQKLNARVKVLFLIVFITVISFVKGVPAQFFIMGFVFLLFAVSRINVFEVYKKIFTLSFFFGFLIIVPAALNLVTDGKIIFTLVTFKSTHQFWIYHIPSVVGFTSEGCQLAGNFFIKVFNPLALTMLIIYTTPFNEIIKSLKLFRVPDLLLMILTLTYKFMFVLSRTIEETYFALKSRWWHKDKKSGADKLVAGRITYLFRKSWIKYEEIYKAMIARGFSGEVDLCYLKKIEKRDVVFIALFVIAGAVSFLI